MCTLLQWKRYLYSKLFPDIRYGINKFFGWREYHPFNVFLEIFSSRAQNEEYYVYEHPLYIRQCSYTVVETNKITLMLFPPPFIGVKIKSPYCPVV